ncbi:hypothetical protein [Candidatus Enterococcus mansonii]|uniref:Uncharacterized protein n=1 Tax=Candidatus Enterococcus mansonii TaxID=1834181 RepID=A0A242CCT8_9ENTE|nr:hypothetical protein [Enterococcus sp. 4G2_DIV0659]OTO07979.1 hypothetical protein A5880_002249 [Enterococcus sp. 4G2_DIV0659]
MKKRRLTLIALLLLVVVTLAACGSKENKKDEESPKMGEKLDKKESDVVSERTEVIDGQEMTIKTFKDGTEVTLPKGINLDDVEIQRMD